MLLSIFLWEMAVLCWAVSAAAVSTTTSSSNNNYRRISSCLSHQFRCWLLPDLRQCVHWSRVCDGRYDCVDRSDEEHCSIAEREVEASSRSEEEERVNRIAGRKNPENVNLSLLRRCVSSYGDPGLTCLSAEEEEECVPHYAWCNGEEEGEPPKHWPCPFVNPNAFSLCSNRTFWQGKTCSMEEGPEMERCSGLRPGQCFFSSSRCDGRLDCLDGSDETCKVLQEPYTRLLDKSSGRSLGSLAIRDMGTGDYFSCGETSHVFHDKLRCDGTKHCPTGIDEDPRECDRKCGEYDRFSTLRKWSMCRYRYDPSLSVCGVLTCKNRTAICDGKGGAEEGFNLGCAVAANPIRTWGRAAASSKGALAGFIAMLLALGGGFYWCRKGKCGTKVTGQQLEEVTGLPLQGGDDWEGEKLDHLVCKLVGLLVEDDCTGTDQETLLKRLSEEVEFGELHDYWTTQTKFVVPLLRTLERERFSRALDLIFRLESLHHGGDGSDGDSAAESVVAMCFKDNHGNVVANEAYEVQEPGIIAKHPKLGPLQYQAVQYLTTRQSGRGLVILLTLIFVTYDFVRDCVVLSLINSAGAQASTMDSVVGFFFTVLVVVGLVPMVAILFYAAAAAKDRRDQKGMLQKLVFCGTGSGSYDYIKEEWDQYRVEVTKEDFRRKKIAVLKIFEATTENLGQLILGVLILLAANTRSPVHESRLGEIFRTNLSAVLVLSVFLGLVSAAASSVKLVSSRRAVSIKGMAILVPYSLLCVATKSAVIILHLSSLLGLFNLLSVWKHLNVPYSSLAQWHQLQHKDNSSLPGLVDIAAVDYEGDLAELREFYSHQSFLAFVAITVGRLPVGAFYLAILTAMVLLTRPQRRSDKPSDAFMLSIVDLMIPCLDEDFENHAPNPGSGTASASSYKRAWRSWFAWRCCSKLAVHLVAHLALVAPLLAACNNISRNFDAVAKVWHPLPSEEASKRNAQILLYAVPVCLLLSVLLQVLLLLAYYRFGHQWTRILFPGKPSKTNGEDGEGGRGEREKEEGGEEVGTAEKIELVEMGSSNRD